MLYHYYITLVWHAMLYHYYITIVWHDILYHYYITLVWHAILYHYYITLVWHAMLYHCCTHCVPYNVLSFVIRKQVLTFLSHRGYLNNTQKLKFVLDVSTSFIELLIIAVINGSSSNIHSFTSQVGIGSSSHDFVGLDSIRCLTSSRVRSCRVVSLSPLYLVLKMNSWINL